MTKTPRAAHGAPDDPEATKRRALKLVAHAGQKAEAVDSERTAAWRYAAAAGASLREIADADGGASHTRVRRALGG